MTETQTIEPEHILWLDLETTGLHHSSPILEVAAVITDMDLNEKARGLWVVNPERGYYKNGVWLHGHKDWVSLMPVNVLEMHVASGLIREAKESRHDLNGVESALASLIQDTCGYGQRVPLGGSGVSHFDLHVIRQQLPVLAEKLTYWTIDVGNVRRFVQRVMGKEFERTEIAHRAMPDVEQSIEEAKRLRTWFAGER